MLPVSYIPKPLVFLHIVLKGANSQRVVRHSVPAHGLLTISFTSLAVLSNLVGFRWPHVNFTFFLFPQNLFFFFVLSIASNKAVTERRWDSQLYSIISITVSLHNPFQLTASRMFLQFSPLQTGLKKETSQRSKLKIQRGKQNKIWGIQNTLFLFQLPNHKFTPISKWKPLLRSNCSLSICVRAKIKSTAALRPK